MNFGQIQCASGLPEEHFGNTFGLKDTRTLRIPFSVVCNSDYCNQVTLVKGIHITDPHLAEYFMVTISGA